LFRDGLLSIFVFTVVHNMPMLFAWILHALPGFARRVVDPPPAHPLAQEDLTLGPPRLRPGGPRPMKAIIHVVYDCVPGAYAGGVQKMVFEARERPASGGRRRRSPGRSTRSGRARRRIMAGSPCVISCPMPPSGWSESDRLEATSARLPPGFVLHAHNSFHPLNVQVGEAAAARGFPVYYHPHGAMDPRCSKAGRGAR
jgi:hypothetical protein